MNGILIHTIKNIFIMICRIKIQKNIKNYKMLMMGYW